MAAKKQIPSKSEETLRNIFFPNVAESPIKKDEILAVRFLDTVWTKQILHVGGVIRFNGEISNGIKLFSQSMFSHTNFFCMSENLTVGAEDYAWVICLDYAEKNDDEFYYVAKEIDFDYLAHILEFDYIEEIYRNLKKKTGTAKREISFVQKFWEYVTVRESNPEGPDGKRPSFEKILELTEEKSEIPDENAGNPPPSDPEIENEINAFMSMKSRHFYGKIPDKNVTVAGHITDKEFKKYFGYLKEFILLGILRNCQEKYGKPYDVIGAVSTGIAPWEEQTTWGDIYFCSEFVTESLLFAGFYPFDFQTKTPKAVTPGDIMDMSIIFKRTMDGNGKESDAVLYAHPKQGEFVPENLADGVSVKSHIINKERGNPEFQRQKMLISAFKGILGYNFSADGYTSKPVAEEKAPANPARYPVKSTAMAWGFVLLGMLGGFILSGMTVLKASVGESGETYPGGISNPNLGMAWDFLAWTILISLEIIFAICLAWVLFTAIIPNAKAHSHRWKSWIEWWYNGIKSRF